MVVSTTYLKVDKVDKERFKTLVLDDFLQANPVMKGFKITERYLFKKLLDKFLNE